MISALFVHKKSFYKSILDDCWDIDRNALLWPGGNPVICHPPCRSWGRLRHFSKATEDEHNLALWCIEQVRKYGGCIEHPYGSKLFPSYLPYPGTFDKFGGFTISINQSWFGHTCEKKTFIYIFGTLPKLLPPFPLNFNLVEKTIPQLSKKNRELTPPNLAFFLVDIAKLCYI